MMMIMVMMIITDISGVHELGAQALTFGSMTIVQAFCCINTSCIKNRSILIVTLSL